LRRATASSCPTCAAAASRRAMRISTNYQIPVYLQDVLTLLAGLGAARVSIIGTSMGGLMAMVLGAMQPQAGRALSCLIQTWARKSTPRGSSRIRGYAGKAATCGQLARGGRAAARRLRIRLAGLERCALGRDRAPELPSPTRRACRRRTPTR